MKSYQRTAEHCVLSILKLLQRDEKASLLDIGCSDGTNTVRYAKAIGTKRIFGMEACHSGSVLALHRSIDVTECDCNSSWPYPDKSMDVIIGNQIIEHLYNTDNFVREISRVLKPNGYAVISTNNLSSWHNFVPLLFGYQPFPCDISNNSSLGKLVKLFSDDAGTFSHMRIFAYQGLIDLWRHYEFEITDIKGVGYYPLWGRLSWFLANLDRRHAAYLTIKISKGEAVIDQAAVG